MSLQWAKGAVPSRWPSPDAQRPVFAVAPVSAQSPTAAFTGAGPQLVASAPTRTSGRGAPCGSVADHEAGRWTGGCAVASTASARAPAPPDDLEAASSVCDQLRHHLCTHPQAAHWYGQALATDPCCVTALIGAADEHRRADRFADAARLYRAAACRGPLSARSLYRLGEVLVQDGHGAEARVYLEQALQYSDAACYAHAMAMMALSHLMDQQYVEALEFCRRVEELHMRSGCGNSEAFEFARILKGVTQLRSGDIANCIETLSDVAREAPGRSQWDELLHLTLGSAETLRANFEAAARHLDAAQHFAGACPSADVLAAAACLRHAQGDLEGAEVMLRRAFDADKDHPPALLRMGYLLLCKGELDRSAQFLQKCLQQPAGTLSYGLADKGTAHLYLCVVVSLRGRGAPDAHAKQLAWQHFREGYTLQPALQHALQSLDAKGDPSHGAAAPASEQSTMLVSGKVARIGTMLLMPDHAAVLQQYAEGLGAAGIAGGGPSGGAHGPGESAAAKTCSDFRLEHARCDFRISADTAETAIPTLVSTNSTMAPTSTGMSRVASDVALGADDARSPTCMKDAGVTGLGYNLCIAADKLLAFADLDLGECISRGEATIVCRGRLLGAQREVVVKMLHANACVRDEDAAIELVAEISVIAGLSHPRLVAFVGACLDSPQLALVTELAPGGNLHHALHVRRRQFLRHERFQLAKDLLEGVRYLHQQQPAVAHLDLKSMNLVLDAEGQHLQICDFGLSRVLGGDAGQERPPSRGGSPRYMAPECHDDRMGPLTEKADVWSSGCILIELFGNCLPYAECCNVQQIVNTMLVHQHGPTIPTMVESPVRCIIKSMLLFQAVNRLAVAQAFLQMQVAALGTENKSRFMWIP